ncbi:MAG: response regulator [Desulfobacterales bacterium]|nr:MAG: response regulator [Desulfobacterales bacterium]
MPQLLMMRHCHSSSENWSLSCPMVATAKMKNKILIVDDIAQNRKLLAEILVQSLECQIRMAANGAAVLDMIEHDLPDLILLDIMMPGMDGFQVSRLLQDKQKAREIPIIFITAKTDVESKVEAFRNGGVDYVTKPFNKDELLARVKAQLRLKNLQDELRQKNRMLADREEHLSHLVDEKTRTIEKMSLGLVTVLENANLANDDETGNHIRRVSEYATLLADTYGADRDFVKRIRLYASLHDVGKVGIADAILKKPGKYTPEEFEEMKQHVVIGRRMLDNAEIDPMARNIAYFHHEKWDGSGYVNGLSGEAIPLEARIVALADVFDALTTVRIYKEAFPVFEAERIILAEKGRHFDPRVVDAFFKRKENFIRIKELLV